MIWAQLDSPALYHSSFYGVQKLSLTSTCEERFKKENKTKVKIILILPKKGKRNKKKYLLDLYQAGRVSTSIFHYNAIKNIHLQFLYKSR